MSNVSTEPARRLIQHVKQNDPMLWEFLRRIQDQLTSIVNNTSTTSSTSIFPLHRTLLIKDTTVANNIADNVPVLIADGQSSKIFRIIGVLQKTITADLQTRIKIVSAGVTSIIGTFTIPHAQALDIPIVWTISFTVKDLDVFQYDILASDGSKSGAGVANYTAQWEPV